MATRIYPYSQESSGAVTDSEHELLWSPIADGILPTETGSALNVTISGSSWQVAAGKMHIAGHILESTSTVSGSLPGAAAATRRSIVAAYVDRTQNPWTKGFELVLGTPGGGLPTLSKSRTGKYQVALRTIQTATSGSSIVLPDPAPRLEPVGLASLFQDPPSWRGYLGANTNYIHNGEYQLAGSFDTEYVRNGEWPQDGHSSIRRVPQRGFYTVNAQVRFSAGNGAAMTLHARVVKNPTSGQASGGTAVLHSLTPRSGSFEACVQVNGRVPLQEGETLGLQVAIIGGASVHRVGGERYETFMEIDWERPI